MILRIDTATGRTWQLTEIPANIRGSKSGPTYVVGWEEVDENPLADALYLQTQAHVGTNRLPAQGEPK